MRHKEQFDHKHHMKHLCVKINDNICIFQNKFIFICLQNLKSESYIINII